MKKDKRVSTEKVKRNPLTQANVDLIRRISTISARAEKIRLSSAISQTKFYKV